MEALEEERLKVSSPKTPHNGKSALQRHPKMKGQQEAFGEIAPKEGSYEKQGKNQSSEGLKQQGFGTQGAKGGGGGISDTPGP